MGSLCKGYYLDECDDLQYVSAAGQQCVEDGLRPVQQNFAQVILPELARKERLFRLARPAAACVKRDL